MNANTAQKKENRDQCLLKKLSIDNFKNFESFSMDFQPLTVVIGNNSVGKSSLLQALAFLKYACTASVDGYMKDRSMKVEDLTSRGLSKIKKIMDFQAEFALDAGYLLWHITFLTDKTNNKIVLRSENLSKIPRDAANNGNGETLLDYKGGKGYRIRFFKNEKTGEMDKELETIPNGSYGYSLISVIDERLGDTYPDMFKIKRFFENTEPLDLLTPRNMRKTVRGKGRSLGMSGEKLPALIQQMSDDEKKKFLVSLKKALPALKNVDSVAGLAGWTHLETMEEFGKRQIKVPASGISDGTLRLMALFSLGFLNKHHGIILLDEVEDGINTSNIRLFLEFLKAYIQDNSQQVLLTTHSSVVMDYTEPEDICYFFRDENGFTRCRPFKELHNVKKQLEFLYPGEIILNTDPGDLLKNDTGQTE